MIHVSGPYRCAKFGANRLRGASVRMGEIYLFIFTFFGNLYLQVRPIDGFSRLMAQTTRTCERVSFGGSVDVSPHFEGEIQTGKN